MLNTQSKYKRTIIKKQQKLKPAEVIQLVKESVSIEQGLTTYCGIDISAAKGRKTKKVPCPFHDEQTPSLAVTPDKNLFNCFGCGQKGDIITLVSLVRSVSQARAAYIIAEDFKLLDKTDKQLKQTIKQKAEYKEREREHRQKEKEAIDFLFTARKTLQANIAMIKTEQDIERKGNVYHLLQELDYYLDLLSSSSRDPLQERMKNHSAVQKFVGEKIYPIYQKYYEKMTKGVSL